MTVISFAASNAGIYRCMFNRIKYIFADFGNPSHFIPFKTSVSFMYNGNITAIIDKLHLLHLDDVLLEEPSLEEIFMHYYA